jgi:diguanylate cyclase (GGDEF)-like protein/PAS domain S-box-containing protein
LANRIPWGIMDGAAMSRPTNEDTRPKTEVAGLRRELAEALYHLPDALVEVDLETGRVLYLNRLAEMLLGYGDEDIKAGLHSRVLFEEEGEYQKATRVVNSFVARSRETGVPYERSVGQDLYEFRMCRKGGDTFYAETQTSFVLDERGVPIRMRTILRDVSPRKEMERRLAELSVRDPLTGCYNRRYLERQQPELERPTARWACLVFDLNDFKAINDTYGHEEGDRVLRSFVHFVSRHHRTDDILVRLGGDEFGLILHADSEKEVQVVSRRILEAASLDSPAGFSMGMAYRRPGEGLEAVLARADRVMYASRGRRLRKGARGPVGPPSREPRGA